MMNLIRWKCLVVVAVGVLFGTQAAHAEEVRFVQPIPATLITKNSKRINGTLEGLAPRVILFRSDRGRQLKMPNYQVRYLRANDGSFRYRPGTDRFTTVLKKAKAINLQLQIENDNRAERAPPPNRNSNMPGDNSEPDPGMGIGGTIPGRSRFPMPGSRFGRTPGMGRNRNFPPSQPGFPGGMPPGANPLDEGMPPGNAFPHGGTAPTAPLQGTEIPEGMDPGIDPGMDFGGMPDGGMPGSSFPSNPFPRNSFPSPSVPTFPGASGPTANDYPTGGPNVVVRKQCNSCRREVPSHLTAGDHCPHCGVLCTYDATNGKRWSPVALGGGIFGGGALIALIVFVIVKLST